MEMKEFARKLFERAKEAGFEDYEIYYGTGSEFETQVFKGEIIGYKSADTAGLSFRGLLGGKMGYAFTQIMDDDAIDLLIDGARTNAQLIENEDKQFIFAGSEHYEELDEFNPALETVTAAEKISMALELEKQTLSQDARVEQVESCGLGTMGGETCIMNSKGLNLSFKQNLLEGYVMPIARDGEEVNTGLALLVEHDRSGVNVEKTAKRAVAEAVGGLHGTPVASGHYPVIFRYDAAASLIATFAGVFSADAAQKGMSLLKGREGEKIASDVVTLVDDPHMKGGIATVPFDAEGVATYRKQVIDGGVLTTLLHNLKTAHKQGVTTTGNAYKASYSAPVGVAPTNFYVKPSDVSFDELMGMAQNGLLITDMMGMHAGADAISGDFSLGASGFRIENGQIGAPVKQITIAGNFYELLKNVTCVASDLEFGFPGSVYVGSPSILVSSMSVAGKQEEK